MKNRKTFWLALLVVALLIAVLFGVFALRQKPAAIPVLGKNKSDSLEVGVWDTATAEKKTLAVTLPISGGLKAFNTAMVKAKVAGEIKNLTVREGDFVRAGQLLATIDTAEYVARLHQAQKSADAAKAQVDIARRSLENNRALVSQNFISATALETSTATLEGANATYQAALASVDVAKKALNDTRVMAPIAGQISLKATQNGERVGPDSRIVEIVDLSRLELEATLSSADAVAVRVGQKANLRIDGVGAPIAATVVRINPSATAGSRAVVVYLQLAGAADVGLRQGLFAQGTLQLKTFEALALPLDVVRSDKPAPYVQVIQGHKVVHVSVQPRASGEVNDVTYVALPELAQGAVALRGAVGQMKEGVSIKLIRPNVPTAPLVSPVPAAVSMPASAVPVGAARP